MAHVEPIAKANMRIGLFGGSFNPAHRGHLHISKTALERLQLDKVWWILSPQNPLKNATDYAPYEERARSARDVIDAPDIELSLFEEIHKITYSVDTIQQIIKRNKDVKFVWLMGADAFAELNLWKDWQMIMETIPIAVFDRLDSGTKALNSRAAQKYSDFRLAEDDVRFLVDKNPPAWSFINQPLDNSSSTKIRALRPA